MDKNRSDYFLFQKEKILKQLRYAKENIDYYKKVLKNIDLERIENYFHFSEKIPILDSEEVIQNPKLFTGNLPISFIRNSSSTIGNPKKVFLTKNDLNLWAKEGRLTLTPYFKTGMTVAFSKRKEKYYLSSLKESIEFSKGKVIMFNPQNTKDIIKCLKKADLILDYAEMIYYISEKIAKSSCKLNKKLIISYTGNKLEELEIEKIKKNFKKAGISVEIYSEYGTTEIGPIGCSDNINHNKFRIIYDNICFIEIIDSETKKPSEQGEILVTSLNREGSVFIRYKMGDVGKISFNSMIPNFHFERRKKGIKIASVFFSPEQVFKIIRRTLNRPLFCEISLKKEKYKNKISIKIVSENSILRKEQKRLRKKLLKELEIEDDIGTTIEFNIIFEKDVLGGNQVRKGYRFIMEEEETK